MFLAGPADVLLVECCVSKSGKARSIQMSGFCRVSHAIKSLQDSLPLVSMSAMHVQSMIHMPCWWSVANSRHGWGSRKANDGHGGGTRTLHRSLWPSLWPPHHAVIFGNQSCIRIIWAHFDLQHISLVSWYIYTVGHRTYVCLYRSHVWSQRARIDITCPWKLWAVNVT